MTQQDLIRCGRCFRVRRRGVIGFGMALKMSRTWDYLGSIVAWANGSIEYRAGNPQSYYDNLVWSDGHLMNDDQKDAMNLVPSAYACQRCGRRDGLDAALPNDLWARVSEGTLTASGEVVDCRWNLLCLWCIDERCDELGIECRCELHFVGRAVHASSNAPPAEETWVDRLRREHPWRWRWESFKVACTEHLARCFGWHIDW